jgi:hypothetical protein
MHVCKKCGTAIPWTAEVAGKKRFLKSRAFCLDCSPFREREELPVQVKRCPLRHRSATPLDLISKEDLQALVDSSHSLADVFRELGMPRRGPVYSIMKFRCERDGIDLSKMEVRRAEKFDTMAKRSPSGSYELRSLDEICTENSSYDRGRLKQRLLKEGVLENRCAECGQEATWKGKNLVLILDHVNGIPNDHRLSNLRCLCPNCNSQSPTFCRGAKRAADS